MKAGNITYSSDADIPDCVPVFPLPGALLLPGGQMPLNIFEPRYMAMIDDALAGDRLIGMFQPASFKLDQTAEHQQLCEIGCLGRITFFQESGDSRYLISLSGICRVRAQQEQALRNGYRNFSVSALTEDFEVPEEDDGVDRTTLEAVFKRYLDANGMQVNWNDIEKANNSTLVTALCMMSPYGPAEKQALLEAENLKIRAETLVALTELALSSSPNEDGSTLQ